MPTVLRVVRSRRKRPMRDDIAQRLTAAVLVTVLNTCRHVIHGKSVRYRDKRLYCFFHPTPAPAPVNKGLTITSDPVQRNLQKIVQGQIDLGAGDDVAVRF
jgi:hypothetical protein